LANIRTVIAYNGQNAECERCAYAPLDPFVQHLFQLLPVAISVHASCCYRYEIGLERARKWGIKLGIAIGLSQFAILVVLFGAQGLAFWYGAQMVLGGEITPNEIFTVCQ
jgi:hypothetical protein